MYGEKEFYSREFVNCQYEDNAEGDRRWNMSRMTENKTVRIRKKRMICPGIQLFLYMNISKGERMEKKSWKIEYMESVKMKECPERNQL